MMNEKQELLTIFMEECAEATVEASKLIRFGSETFGEVHRLEIEIGDVLCMINLLEEYGLINMLEVNQHIANKRKKLQRWSDLSKVK